MRGISKLMLAIVISGAAACRSDSGAPTRTFVLKYLDAKQAGELVRQHAPSPGVMVSIDSARGTLTISAPGSELDQVAQVIAKYDVPTPDTHLYFQVIEADGFTTKDPEIAEVETALRSVFKFTGYRLVASAAINTRAPGSFEQWAGGSYLLRGTVSPPQSPDVVNLDISLRDRSMPLLTTSVTIPGGQVVVVGSSRPDASKPTVILVVRTKKE